MALRPVTLITGASSGIGAALARIFAANRHEVVLVARREQLLRGLADEIAATGAPRPLVLRADVARVDAGRRIGEALATNGVEPDIMVNNAGFGLVGNAASLDRAEQLAMIDLNVRALTDLCLAFADSLERRTWPRSRPFCPAPAWPSITPARPMCCRSPRRCVRSWLPRGCG